jgi:hypothetical protein
MRSRLSDEFDEFVVLASPRLLLFAYRLTATCCIRKSRAA